MRHLVSTKFNFPPLQLRTQTLSLQLGTSEPHNACFANFAGQFCLFLHYCLQMDV
ncbi:hypothetical protein Hanom_Chr11g01041451 [Helianthus anomalus]